MLHCPATLYLARHGDADYAHAHVMSDDGGWLSELGREQVAACAKTLAGERISAVYCSPLQRAVESAEVAGEVLGLRRETLPGLAEVGVGDFAGRAWDDPGPRQIYDAWAAGDLSARIPGGASGTELIAAFTDALSSIADRHRGEQTLVFSHGAIMGLVVPHLVATGGADLALRKYIPNAVPARIEASDEGWRVLSWPGSADVAVV